MKKEKEKNEIEIIKNENKNDLKEENKKDIIINDNNNKNSNVIKINDEEIKNEKEKEEKNFEDIIVPQENKYLDHEIRAIFLNI